MSEAASGSRELLLEQSEGADGTAAHTAPGLVLPLVFRVVSPSSLN